ncbi:uncharacterized protein [Procambarus clarkii]|uniref:uncharacterized protein n=1 Tax=Procambarus clarkii TaxID=6728 RepID=UPI001E676E22|nr:uncharacterized protein LOC123768577 [Procambarus clarkii]
MLRVGLITVTLALLAFYGGVGGQILNIDLATVIRELNNRDSVELHVACAAGQGPCDMSGQQLRRYIPEVSTSGRCFRCTTQENRNIRVLVSTLQRRYPRCWQVIIAVYENRQGVRPTAKGCAH